MNMVISDIRSEVQTLKMWSKCSTFCSVHLCDGMEFKNSNCSFMICAGLCLTDLWFTLWPVPGHIWPWWTLLLGTVHFFLLSLDTCLQYLFLLALKEESFVVFVYLFHFLSPLLFTDSDTHHTHLSSNPLHPTPVWLYFFNLFCMQFSFMTESVLAYICTCILTYKSIFNILSLCLTAYMRTRMHI